MLSSRGRPIWFFLKPIPMFRSQGQLMTNKCWRSFFTGISYFQFKSCRLLCRKHKCSAFSSVGLLIFISEIIQISLNTLLLETVGGGQRNFLASSARRCRRELFCFHHSSEWLTSLCVNQWLMEVLIQQLKDLMLVIVLSTRTSMSP